MWLVIGADRHIPMIGHDFIDCKHLWLHLQKLTVCTNSSQKSHSWPLYHCIFHTSESTFKYILFKCVPNSKMWIISVFVYTHTHKTYDYVSLLNLWIFHSFACGPACNILHKNLIKILRMATISCLTQQFFMDMTRYNFYKHHLYYDSP